MAYAQWVLQSTNKHPKIYIYKDLVHSTLELKESLRFSSYGDAEDFMLSHNYQNTFKPVKYSECKEEKKK